MNEAQTTFQGKSSSSARFLQSPNASKTIFFRKRLQNSAFRIKEKKLLVKNFSIGWPKLTTLQTHRNLRQIKHVHHINACTQSLLRQLFVVCGLNGSGVALG
ncbi:MAG: hypothetical protein IPM82_24110 [Saprospiraceae bacterium]|nr:hypothetical protein [Saprospiraceae bacterium]